MFELNPDADISSTTRITKVLFPPKFFFEHFGKPLADDKHGISGRYIFTNEEGAIFTIYDPKAATLHHGKNSDYLTPKEFWQGQLLEELYIGGMEDANPKDFISWLADEYCNNIWTLGRFLWRHET